MHDDLLRCFVRWQPTSDPTDAALATIVKRRRCAPPNARASEPRVVVNEFPAEAASRAVIADAATTLFQQQLSSLGEGQTDFEYRSLRPGAVEFGS